MRQAQPEREADVQATLGTALAWTGRSRQGLTFLDRAVEVLSRGLGRTCAHAARRGFSMNWVASGRRTRI